MQLKLVGAGLGRTGTHSLKVALERLLGAPCHHMVEVFQHPEQWAKWQAAVDGEPLSAWGDVYDGYVATVDWPGCRWYRELAEANPDAVVLLSLRADADEWWRSASNTIFTGIPEQPTDDWGRWANALIGDHIGDFRDPDAAKAGYERHAAEVRASIPASRLVEWRASDGWAPLCEALGVAVPEEPFPLTNTSEEWLARRAKS